MDKRQGFAWLYDAHHSAHSEDLPFWISVSQRHAGQPVLELGCGSGRVALALAQAGCRLTGLDIDPEMLAISKKRLDEMPGLALNLIQADMTTFCLDQAFGAILLPCNTLSIFTFQDRQKIINLAARHLQSGGWFAASIPNPAYLRSLPASSASELEEIFIHPLDQEPVQVSSRWNRDREFFTVTWYYDHLLPDGRVDRTEVQVRHSLDLFAIYQDQLARAGLLLKETYGDFDLSACSHHSPHLILVAQQIF